VKKLLTYLLYALILGVMVSVAFVRILRGCRQFLP
jgi:hypothetical protein